MYGKAEGKSEKMSAPGDIKSEGIQEVPMDDTKMMKEACDLCDRGIEEEKRVAKIEGIEIINHLKPKIPFLMKKLGFLIGGYKVTEEIKFVPLGKEYNIKSMSPGDYSAKLYITTERMKFLFCALDIYDIIRGKESGEVLPYLVLIGLKCKECDTWVTIPYVNAEDDYAEYYHGSNYSIENKQELGKILRVFSGLRCPECHELLLGAEIGIEKGKKTNEEDVSRAVDDPIKGVIG